MFYLYRSESMCPRGVDSAVLQTTWSRFRIHIAAGFPRNRSSIIKPNVSTFLPPRQDWARHIDRHFSDINSTYWMISADDFYSRLDRTYAARTTEPRLCQHPGSAFYTQSCHWQLRLGIWAANLAIQFQIPDVEVNPRPLLTSYQEPDLF